MTSVLISEMSTLLKSIFCRLLSSKRLPSCFESCFPPWWRSVLGVVGGVGGPWGWPKDNHHKIMFWVIHIHLFCMHTINCSTWVCVSHLYDQRYDPRNLPIAPFQVQLYTCDGLDQRRHQTHSDLASHSFVASAGIYNPGDLSCAELSIFRLLPQTVSFHSPSAVCWVTQLSVIINFPSLRVLFINAFRNRLERRMGSSWDSNSGCLKCCMSEHCSLGYSSDNIKYLHTKSVLLK